ncbi:hypothetical protein [Sinomicrobium weinanense]|uniref:Uncharacterized protein n=1 Tax=Sinomicrobium weinanense TaxID=2842200 RepID=A0A926JU08_9FLAO|nr:hypothetical protein [Sinomicrobium weinanense]MBC9797503.1 hypothetical protein [Sinomicrobium weinanense]MBU3122211.1 hypothetical protein [Sinomicrobium weinanense]
MKKTLVYIGIILILTIIGFLISNLFIEVSLSQLDQGNTQIVSTSIGGQFYAHLIFALALGSIPVLYLIAGKFARLKFIKQSIITCGIVIGCGILAWQFRVFLINRQLLKMSEYPAESRIQNAINYQDLHFGSYLFTGFIIGTICSILIFSLKNNSMAK